METKNQPLSSRDIERICDASLELNPYFDYGEIVFFLSNFEKVDKITLKFEKSNFIHLLGLEVSKSFLKNSWLVNCPSKELFYNLCLIKRIEDQDYELKYSHREIREKIEAVEFFSKCFKKGGIFSKANDKNQKTIGADCFISNNELQIGLREIEPDVFVPVSAQKAKTHKKINLHQRFEMKFLY